MSTPTRSIASQPAKDTTRKPHHEVALRLNLLIHTIHEITQHEEDLCSLMHELRRADRIARDVQAELDQLLSSLPFRSFQRDLHAVERALRRAPPARRRAPVRKPVKTRKAAVSRARKAPAKPARSRTESKPRSR